MIDDKEEGWSLGNEGVQRLTLSVQPTNCTMTVKDLETNRTAFQIDGRCVIDLDAGNLPAGTRLGPRTRG